MATLQEVADKAGVSTATVSRLLNNPGIISSDTKLKIEQAMKETGFNPAKRRRRTPKHGTPAFRHSNVVMLWNTGIERESSYYGQNMMQGVSEALQEMNVSLTVAHINDNSKPPPALLGGNIDGVIIHGPPPSPVIMERLKKFAVVWLLQAGAHDFGDRVQPDHAYTGELACEYLADHGCHHLCCISNENLPSNVYEAWRTAQQGFLNSAEAHGRHATLLTCPEVSALNSSPSEIAASAKQLIDDFLKLTPRPDGLYVTCALWPYIHKELTRNGIIPMKDLLLVAGSAHTSAQHNLDPMHVTISHSSANLGRLAVNMLQQRINHPDLPRITCSVKSELIIPE